LSLIRDDLATAIVAAAAAAQAAGDLPAVGITDAHLERTTASGRGDYASSLALRLARAAGMPPLAIAQQVAARMSPHPAIERVEVAAPGFLNLHISAAWLQSQVDGILERDANFGRVDIGAGKRLQVEFVSANPTGYLTAVAGRAGALGDALAHLLAFAGYRVEREFYINDAGNQLQAFTRSIRARFLQSLGIAEAVPDDGYHGPAIIEIANQIRAVEGDRFAHMAAADAERELGRLGLAIVLRSIKEDAERFGIRFDVWFSEQSLHDRGATLSAIEHIERRGFVAQREGAVWFTSTELGDERDHVLIRSNGAPTYLAADIAYHHDKFVIRGFDRVIDVWGADHHGHIPAMKAGVRALGIEPEQFTVLLHQMVTIKRGTEIVRMSKRAGDYVALRDVIDEVGTDAARYFFLSRSTSAHIDFDLELAARQSDDNPVYYVQYGHARTSSILRRAAELGYESLRGEVGLLSTEEDLALIRKILQFPEVVDLAARSLEPHHLTYYARELASAFSQFYENCRVLTDDRDLSAARLKLVRATRIALRNCLALMGMSAPDRMDRD